MSAEHEDGERRLAPPGLLGLTLVGLLVLQGATALRLAPPAARGTEAPAADFSAERAFARLERLLSPGEPHPLGTPANARVRERLLAVLRELGCEVEVQEAWAWSPRARGATVKNVLARVPGPGHGQGPCVLLLSHYDSVPAGPGASDDGMGVAATLEVVRALRAGPPPARPVRVLVTDGEELGLLGARAFVREHPWARELGAVVNLEARGTSGPSFMFQTSRGNAPLVRLLAGSATRPLCSSLFPTVYELLPNDTDLTVFLESEDPPPAFNFACIGDVDRYHTPQDDLAHLSRDTLQHHGENALGLVRALTAAPLEPLRGDAGRLVYFDLLGLVVVRWPEPWSLPLALLALCLLGLGTGLRVREGELPPGGLGWGAALWLAALLAPLALALGTSWLLVRVTGSPSPWAASPLAGHLLFQALAWSLGGAAGALLVPRAGAWGAWSGVWLAWALLGGVLAAALPGASFALVAPALVAGVCGLPAALRPGARALRALAWIAPCLFAALLWLPLARGLDWALGLLEKPPVTAAAALLLCSALPLLPAGRLRWALPAAGLVLALGCLGVLLVSGPHSPERPQRVNVVFEQDADGGTARWSVDTRFGAVPRAMVAAAGLAPEDGRTDRLVARAEPERLTPPELTVLGEEPGPDGARRLRVRVRSPRGAWGASLRLEPRARAITAQGQRLAPAAGLAGCDLLALPPEGLELLLELPAGEVGWTLFDTSGGVPASGAALLGARPAWAVQSQQGDLTTVTRGGRF